MSLGKTLARLRTAKGWKQTEFAAKIDIHPSHVTRWEQDRVRPRVKMLEKIAEVFEVSVEELLGGDARTRTRNGIFKVKDHELLEMLGQIHRLDQADLEAIKRIVGAMLTRIQMAEVVSGQNLSQSA